MDPVPGLANPLANHQQSQRDPQSHWECFKTGFLPADTKRRVEEVLPLFHLDNLVSVQSSHLQLSVEVADGESDEVLVSDPTLQYTCSDVMIEERPHCTRLTVCVSVCMCDDIQRD